MIKKVKGMYEGGAFSISIESVHARHFAIYKIGHVIAIDSRTTPGVKVGPISYNTKIFSTRQEKNRWTLDEEFTDFIQSKEKCPKGNIIVRGSIDISPTWPCHSLQGDNVFFFKFIDCSPKMMIQSNTFVITERNAPKERKEIKKQKINQFVPMDLPEGYVLPIYLFKQRFDDAVAINSKLLPPFLLSLPDWLHLLGYFHRDSFTENREPKYITSKRTSERVKRKG